MNVKAQLDAGMAGGRPKAADLDLRRKPLQARGRATFERILETTAQLLEELGAEAITTNLVAKAAAVNVATLYQYFPNKQALLLELFQSQADDRKVIGEAMVRGLGDNPDWRRQLELTIDAIAAERRRVAGAAALRQAMRSTPELLEYDLQGTKHAAQALAHELVKGGRASVEQAELVARCSIEILAAVLDLWAIDSGARDDRIIAELKVGLSGYLAPYLDPAPGKGRVS
ncbi:MAG: TetR/AcrR family transcriptional regulator [Pseudomonadales bacterium]